MIGRLKDHLRHHAIAYVALFIILGGTAVALPGKGSVTSNDIAKKAVKTKAIAKKAVKKKNLGNEAVTTAKIADNAVTRAKAKGLIEGDGSQETVSYTEPAVGFLPTSRILAEVPGMGVIEFIACFPESSPGAADIRTRALAFDDAQPYFAAGTVTGGGNPSGAGPGTTTDQFAGFLTAGGGNPLIAESAPGALGVSGWWDWHMSRGTGNATVGAHVTVSGFNSSSSITPTGECTVTATVEYQD